MVEDLNEEPYMVDAGLHHLIRAGKFDGVAGFVFGTDVNLKGGTRSRRTSARACRSRRSSTS